MEPPHEQLCQLLDVRSVRTSSFSTFLIVDPAGSFGGRLRCLGGLSASGVFLSGGESRSIFAAPISGLDVREGDQLAGQCGQIAQPGRIKILPFVLA